jgi:hypothetical protein
MYTPQAPKSKLENRKLEDRKSKLEIERDWKPETQVEATSIVRCPGVTDQRAIQSADPVYMVNWERDFRDETKGEATWVE